MECFAKLADGSSVCGEVARDRCGEVTRGGCSLSWNCSVTRTSCTYGSRDKTLDQICRCVRDSLLAYRLKFPPATNRALHSVQTYEGAEL